MTKIIKAIMSIVAFSTFSGLTVAQVYGAVEGTVIDLKQVSISDVRIFVDNSSEHREVMTNESGYFSVDVPDGIYSITTKKQGWYPAKRSNFKVTNGLTTKLVLVLETDFNPKTFFDEFEIPNSPEKAPKLVIEYETKKSDKNGTIYEGVRVSLDDLTVIADRMIFNPNGLLLKAVGSVAVFEGGAEKHSQKRTFRFSR